jgi:hypothetical protein
MDYGGAESCESSGTFKSFPDASAYRSGWSQHCGNR